MKQNQTASTYYLHVLTMALVLSLFGIALLAWLHTLGLEQKIYLKTPAIVELNNSYTKDSLQQLETFLKSKTIISPESVEWVGKDQALAEMQNELSLRDKMAGENPFNDIILFRFNKSSYDEKQVDALSAELKEWKIINGVNFENIWSENISKTVNGIKWTSLISCILLSLMVLAIIWHLVKVYVYEKNQLVKTMINLGASEDTILKPYYKISIIHGLASACIGVVFLGLAILIFTRIAPWMYELLELKKFFFVIAVLILIGPIVQWTMVKKHFQHIIKRAK